MNNSRSTLMMMCSCTLTLCLLLVMTEVVSTAPTSYDYDSAARDVYEMLMERAGGGDSLIADPLFANSHRVVRKNNRTPSLRLRFGRRSDPSLLSYSAAVQGDHSLEHGLTDN